MREIASVSYHTDKLCRLAIGKRRFLISSKVARMIARSLEEMARVMDNVRYIGINREDDD